MNKLILTGILALTMTARAEEIRLITLDPGHFHAALVQKTRYPQVSPVVHVYAPAGADLDQHLKRVEGFNLGWEEKVYTGPDFLEKMLAEKAGNVVVISGNNARKTEYIYKCIDAGLNVLADKPMAIDPAGFELLKKAFALAEKKHVLLYDIMTERHEITTVLQRALSQSPAVFGKLEKGTPDQPAITKESVHHFLKEVAGKPLIRPAWFFDVTQQGEALPDVGTHLVDLIQWECFPEKTLNPSDVKILTARRWATKLSPEQFKKVTGVERTSELEPYCNGATTYTLRGVHAKVSVMWEFDGGADTHYSMMRGSKANLVIQNGKLRIETKEDIAAAARTALAAWPGVEVQKTATGWDVIIPASYNVGHEAHFGQVTAKYLKHLADGKLPSWEVPNMITKYATTTGAYKLSHADDPIAPTGKIDLYNGKDFTGWKLFLPGNADVTKTWSIENGVIKCTGKPAGYIRTEKTYRDYKLTVEWRFTKAGNTGVLVHMSLPDKVWPKSIECQGLSEHQGDFWLIDGTTFNEHTNKKSHHVPIKIPHNEKPIGEWNTYEIICDGDTIRPYVNGKLMNEATGCTVTSGHILIQSEGGEIEIRKVFLEPVKK